MRNCPHKSITMLRYSLNSEYTEYTEFLGRKNIILCYFDVLFDIVHLHLNVCIYWSTQRTADVNILMYR